MDAVWAEADAVFAHADRMFKQASKMMDEHGKTCRVQPVGQQTVSFQATDLCERCKNVRTFVRMALQMAFSGRAEIQIKRRRKN